MLSPAISTARTPGDSFTVGVSLTIMTVMTVALYAFALRLLRQGTGMRE